MTSSKFDLKDYTLKCRKILGAGLNYMDMVKSGGAALPEKPIIFMKPTSSLIHENQDIIVSEPFSKIAHEVELGVIIGKKCKNVSKSEAMQYVGGYCLALDMTAQCVMADLRPKGLPWTLGKAFDTATPVSGSIPSNMVTDPHNLQLRLTVNGKQRQCGNTSDMIFKIPDLIEYISKYMTLEPYDLILTGTPGGAGQVCPGDTIECALGDLVEMKFQVKGEC